LPRWISATPAVALPVALLVVLGAFLAYSVYAGGTEPEAREGQQARRPPQPAKPLYVVETEQARHVLLELEELGEWPGGEVLVVPRPGASAWLHLDGAFLADVDPDRIVDLRGP
jgi:hypothetical protein